MVPTSPKILALSGGVGGAKLALGLAQVVPSDALTVVVNTGDDFEHLGLKVCPDLDTLMYTLSGLANQTLGWGQQDETWQFLDALKRLGGDTWFGLGDRDLATHVHRTALLAQGDSLSAVTARLMRSLGVLTQVVPMTDDSVATLIHCQNGETLSFQHYFVRDRCEPLIKGISFDELRNSTTIGADHGLAHRKTLQDDVRKILMPERGNDNEAAVAQNFVEFITPLRPKEAHISNIQVCRTRFELLLVRPVPDDNDRH